MATTSRDNPLCHCNQPESKSQDQAGISAVREFPSCDSATIRPWPCGTGLAESLKQQLEGELNLPRGIGGANGPEGCVGRLGVWYSEIRVVQEIEEL